jgi:hypothetical protein
VGQFRKQVCYVQKGTYHRSVIRKADDRILHLEGAEDGERAK